MDETITFWFSGFEKGVEAMTPLQRETLFSACGQNCVKQGTLAFYQQIYEEAGGDLDMFFQTTNQVPGLRAEILAPGSKYIFCFPAAAARFIHKAMSIHRTCVNVPAKVFYMC